MSALKDEPLEKSDDDKFTAWDMPEEVFGTVACWHCDYRGRMEGMIPAGNRQNINFKCSKCEGLIQIKNPEYMQ